jgi:hypothetical protein
MSRASHAACFRWLGAIAWVTLLLPYSGFAEAEDGEEAEVSTEEATEVAVEAFPEPSPETPAPVPTALMAPVEWDVAGEEVWPRDQVLPPLAVLRQVLEASGHPVRTSPRPKNACFSEGCAHREAVTAGARMALLSALVRTDTMVTAKIALYDTVTREVRAVRVSWTEKPGSPRLEKLREAALSLLNGSGDIEGGRMAEIAWLRARPERNARPIAKWAAPIFGAAILLTAYLEGQFSADAVSQRPSQPLLPEAGAHSFLPGMFSGFSPPTAQAGRAGSGMALAIGAEAALVSPAGIAPTMRPELLLTRSSLPDGMPEFQAAFAAPAGPGFAQGYSLRYRGDGLSDEAVLGTTWAVDFGWFHSHFIGMQAGATVKLYLAEVGRGGTGEERSRGHSFGTGIDVGFRARLMRGVMAAAALEDAASWVRHRNDFTDATGYEIRAPRLWLGASLKPTESIGLTIDGRKGLHADQGDVVSVGLERTLIEVLRLRCGMQEVFGRETVRKIAAGFGLRNDGFENKFGGRRLAVDYGFEYGLDEATMLAGGHRFGLMASF